MIVNILSRRSVAVNAGPGRMDETFTKVSKKEEKVALKSYAVVI